MTKELSYQLKILKHLGVADIEKVKHYLAIVIFEKITIDKALFMRSSAFVKREYTMNERAFCPEAVFTRKEQRSYI